MIALDTNVLVRFLTQDDAEQFRAATDFMGQLSETEKGYICREVIVELVWVLERSYGLSRPAIAEAIEGFLSAAEIVVEAFSDVGTALFQYRDGGAGFADLMILAAARRAGATSVVTFDRVAAKVDGVTLLKPQSPSSGRF